MRRGLLDGRAFVREKTRQPAADAVVRERIGAVGPHDGRVVRKKVVVEPVADTQVRCNARQHREQRLLESIQAGIEPRGRQHQPIDRSHAARHQAGSDQPAQAVAQQHQR